MGRTPSDGERRAVVVDGRPWYVANELLAFLIEIVALGLLCWWGFASGGGVGVSVLLGLGTPAVAAALWGLFAAPRAPFRPPLPGVLLVKGLVLGGGALALYGVGHPVGAVAVAVVTLVNVTVAEVFRRPAPGGTEPAPGAAAP
ncbi:YrdB family protein [Streptomyces collinus]|uniref:YrdB family protein n=1 Tax=Streptomyces collinus TaxID=42684 RepID=UPI00069362B6|nr:YrdB family protein [Streptomyces collinus]